MSRSSVPHVLAHNRARRVPMVMQMEALECGAACLTMILGYFGLWVPLEEVRYACGISRDGSRASRIVQAARNYHFDAKGFLYSVEDVRERNQFPCILHWNANHFVVLCGFKGEYAIIQDPALGPMRLTIEEFAESFSGVALYMEPTDAFKPQGKQKSITSFIKHRLKRAYKTLIVLMCATALITLGDMAFPAFARIFVDEILPGAQMHSEIIFFAALSISVIAYLALSGLREVLTNHAEGEFSVSSSAEFMWHLMHMPMEFFGQRAAGDLQQRQFMNETIIIELLNILAPLAIHLVSLILYAYIMVTYDVVLSLVGISFVLFNLIVSQVIAKRHVNITRIKMRDEAMLASTGISGIELIETIKASGTERGFFARWSGFQANVNAQAVRLEMLEGTLGLLPLIADLLSDVCLLFVGALLAMQGNMTIGTMVAFQGLISSFKRPADTLINSGREIQELRTRMERIEDVMQYQEDPMLVDQQVDMSRAGIHATLADKGTAVSDKSEGVSGSVASHEAMLTAENVLRHAASQVHIQEEPQELRKLSGEVELKGVTFGYSRLDEPLIKDFSFHITPGKQIALVGPSGCGKSTIAKLISGLYHPWSGEVLFAGVELTKINRNVLRGSIAVVDQELTLFEDTIANNLKMWDSSIEDFEIIMAARDAQVHEDIILREGGYRHRLREGGKNFSGGQRQRLEIARMLAQDPTIVIMDEATSALDAKTEAEVIRAIKRRGVSSIIIAHRLSTIRDADEIIVLDQGNIVARGTHEQLIADDGLYRQLVAAE